MTNTAKLKLNNKLFEPEKCTFGIQIETQRYTRDSDEFLYGLEYLSVNYWIDIRVDENSGDDGAPAPEAIDIPVLRVSNGQNLFPTELPGIVVDDQNDWDAWYGNDAPELSNNKIVFNEFNNETILLDWTAQYGWETKKEFYFSGPLIFDQIKMRVKSEQDSDVFFKHIFGDKNHNKVTKKVGDWCRFGAGTSEEELRWLNITFDLH